MKIAEVICLFGPEETTSGAVQVVLDTVSALRSLGHTVAVFSGRRTAGVGRGLIKDEWPEGVGWWSVDIKAALNPGSATNYQNASAEEHFKEFLAIERPDVIHFHALQGLGAGLVDYASRENIPFVVHMHDWWWFCPYLFLATLEGEICREKTIFTGCDCIKKKDFFLRRSRYLSAVMEKIPMIICVSDSEAQSLKRLGVDGERLALCENPVRPFPTHLPLALRKGPVLKMVYLGGPSVHKGFYLLRKALKAVNGPWQIEYYGFDDSPPLSWKTKILSWGRRKREVYRPRYRRDDLPRILANVDVVVVPSVAMESYNLVVREAMLCGCPVVASRSGGPEGAILDGMNGWLFERGNAEDLGAVLQRLIDDPRLVRQTQDYLQEHPIHPPNLEQYAQVIDSLLAEALTRRRTP